MKRSAVISIKDPLTVSVTNTFEVTCEKDEQGNIEVVHVPDFPPLVKGKKLVIGHRKIPYCINHINVRTVNGLDVYDLCIAKRTKASLFILPMFKGTKKKYFYDDQLLNCFLGVPGQERVIALLYRFSGVRSFMELEKAFEGMPNFLYSQDPDRFSVLYVFEVPEKHMRNYELFLKGKYSQMSTAYKHRILQFHGLMRTSSIGQILYRSKKRKLQLEEKIVDPAKYSKEKLADDAEVYSVPNIVTETYDPEVYDL